MRLLVACLVVCFLAVSCTKSPDRFSVIDGKKIHILERGEGSPVVVFLTGQICPLEHFYTVQSQISKITKTFSYDRSGLGLSDILDTIRTYDHVANELDAVLKNEHLPAPYILVAHSYGGGVAKQYYKQFPEKVAGFVFVDCANDEVFFDSLFQRKFLTEKDFGPDSIATPGERYEMTYTLENIISFEEPLKTDLPAQLLVAAGKGRGLPDEIISIKVNTYKQFNKDAPKMKIIITEHSGHVIQRDQPELVIKSIKDVVDEVRRAK